MMKSGQLELKGRKFLWGTRTYVMGILNITPDSFSGDGMLSGVDISAGGARTTLEVKNIVKTAMDLARRFVSSGADILDVGGESTRPGAQPLDADEEIERVVPVIQALASELDTIISIDTYKARVAEAALRAGANMVNDVWSLHADSDLAEVVAHFNVPIILMHNRSSWVHAQIKERLGGRYVGIPYDALIEDIKRELLESVQIAKSSGIPDEHIILDPGIGFGKTVEQNLELLDKLGEIRSLGYPLLVGPSRKSFIGYTLDLPPHQRLEGTAAAVSVCIVRGADIVRVHDVDFMVRVVRMTDAIVRRN